MPLYKYEVTLLNGNVKNHEGTFNDVEEILEYVKKEYKGEWEYSSDSHETEYFKIKDIPISIRIKDTIAEENRLNKVKNQIDDFIKNNPPKRKESYREKLENR